MPKQKRAGKLLDILYMRDDEFVPAFCRALEETEQQHVVRDLYKGLHTFVLLLFYTFISLIKQVSLGSFAGCVLGSGLKVYLHVLVAMTQLRYLISGTR